MIIRWTEITYNPSECAVFWKVAEKHGGCSNMAGGYPLTVNGHVIRTSEALYQACRFPHLPDVQKLIIEQKSPMSAKMVGKPYRLNTRPDWDNVRVLIMGWCLRVKFVQNRDKFGKVLFETGDLPIVEKSRKDPFWGAVPDSAGNLVGSNVLGQLLTNLREELRDRSVIGVGPLTNLPDFSLYGEAIQPVLG
jgi:ribA/ribD-fused uncharacterized protein